MPVRRGAVPWKLLAGVAEVRDFYQLISQHAFCLDVTISRSLAFSTEKGVIDKAGSGLSPPTVKNVDVVDHVTSVERLLEILSSETAITRPQREMSSDGAAFSNECGTSVAQIGLFVVFGVFSARIDDTFRVSD